MRLTKLKQCKFSKQAIWGILGIALMGSAPLAGALPPVESRTGGIPSVAPMAAAAPGSTRIDGLQQEIQELRGTIEVQSHLIKRLEQRLNLLQSSAEKKAQVTRPTIPQPVKPKEFAKGIKMYLPHPPDAVQPGMTLAESGDLYETDDARDLVRQETPAPYKPAPLPLAVHHEEGDLLGGSRPEQRTKKEGQLGEEATKNDKNKKVEREEELYEAAYAKIRHKQYLPAFTAFQEFLKKFPSGQYAGYAHYWLGEVSLLQWQEGKADLAWLEKAKEAFAHILSKFPDHPKARDALLKLGMIEVEKSNWDGARNYFKDVKQRYPGTAAAGVAESQLKKLKEGASF